MNSRTILILEDNEERITAFQKAVGAMALWDCLPRGQRMALPESIILSRYRCWRVFGSGTWSSPVVPGPNVQRKLPFKLYTNTRTDFRRSGEKRGAGWRVERRE